MHVEVNGTRLWFDVDGVGTTTVGAVMVRRPTVVLVHGGPGSYDHTYFKPHFSALTDVAQVVYLDLRDHGRSQWGDSGEWSFEICADDLRAFCDVLGIESPIVYGHSMGGFVTMLYGTRHPGHGAGLVLASTLARFDLDRLVKGVAAVTDPNVAELARRDFSGDPVTESEWARVFTAFGPNVPSTEELARRVRNPAVGERGMDLLRRLDLTAMLGHIEAPTLILVGDRDGVTSVEAAQEISAALPDGVGRLEVLPGAGHFAWLDAPDRYWDALRRFVAEVG